jgi:phosphoribosylformylglycinamidine synthase
MYDRTAARPEYLDELWADEPEIDPDLSAPDILRVLLDDPAIGDRSWISSQYDHMLFLNTIIEPGHDGSLMRIKGTTKALAVSTDGDAFRTYLDPRRGGARIVFEAAMNVAVTGTRPYAVVDNLNFGNPENPEVMWQFIESIEGMAWACEELDLPVVGGNVSFYNQTDGIDIYPAPVVGMLGFTDTIPENPPRLDAAQEGMGIWILGGITDDDLAGSAVDRIVNGKLRGRPKNVDGDTARRTISAIADLAARGTPVVHDISNGGLAVALAEVAITSDVGLTVAGLGVAELFDETPLRAVVVDRRAPDTPIPSRRIGTVGGVGLDFGASGSIPVVEAAEIWRTALPRRMG